MAQLEVYYANPEMVNEQTARVILEDDEAHHLLRVRRARQGEEIVVINGLGDAWNACLIDVNNQNVELELVSKMPNWREPPISVSLGLGVIKQDHFNLAVDTAVQLGVSEITPLSTRYVSQKWSDSKTAKANRRARSASKQCGRGLIPEVYQVKPLKEWCIEQNEKEYKFVLSESGDIFPGIPQTSKVALAIGCEGGFSKEEEEYLSSVGFIPVTLGIRRLRSETAVASALSQIIGPMEA